MVVEETYKEDIPSHLKHSASPESEWLLRLAAEEKEIHSGEVYSRTSPILPRLARESESGSRRSIGTLPRGTSSKVSSDGEDAGDLHP